MEWRTTAMTLGKTLVAGAGAAGEAAKVAWAGEGPQGSRRRRRSMQ